MTHIYDILANKNLIYVRLFVFFKLVDICRYDQLWMPMISDLTPESGKPPMILPPLDVEWVWFCHTLNPVYIC